MASDPSSDLTIADLYQEYQAQLFRFAISLSHDPAQASDLTQETLIKAMSYLDLLKKLNPYQRRAWLFQVLKNKYLDQRRSRLRVERVIEQLIEQSLESDVAPPQPAIASILNLIPQQYREVLEKRHILGMTSQEIGEELGIPAGTVRSRLRLATAWMRANKSMFI